MSPYILACTRFGSVASRKGIHHMFQIKLDLKRWPSESSMKGVADIWFTKWRQDVHDFAEFVILVKELALMQPAYRIVLRPHDNESLLFYEQAFSPYKNVEVIREGNVLNWIRGAELVLHSNCTTGIEAVLAGRPVLNFLPGDRDRSALDVEVAREAGTIARSVTESLETAGALLSGKGQAQNWSPHALSILNNLERQAIPLLVSETLAVTQEHGITGSKLVLPPQPAARNFARRMAGRPKLKLSACWGSKPGMLELDHVEMILEGYRAMGDGGGHIREFSSQYVIIDP